MKKTATLLLAIILTTGCATKPLPPIQQTATVHVQYRDGRQFDYAAVQHCGKWFAYYNLGTTSIAGIAPAFRRFDHGHRVQSIEVIPGWRGATCPR